MQHRITEEKRSKSQGRQKMFRQFPKGREWKKGQATFEWMVAESFPQLILSSLLI